mmetsp:Transcript_71522/g.141835  ORF Transcript_71522/g.141835 Transcript_71522/m.141835 type:complete len:90 (-) Transcript_71522:2136-2405(-)
MPAAAPAAYDSFSGESSQQQQQQQQQQLMWHVKRKCCCQGHAPQQQLHDKFFVGRRLSAPFKHLQLRATASSSHREAPSPAEAVVKIAN